MIIFNPKKWYNSLPDKKIETEFTNYKKNYPMKKFFVWECIFYFLCALSALISAIICVIQGNNYAWQIITFFSITLSFMKTLKIKKYEKNPY